MAFAGPFALTRRRPALASPFCLVSFLSPFSARHCFARFCAFVAGRAFRRLRRESALSPWKSGFCAYGKSRFRLRKTSVVFPALCPAGRWPNGKIRGNFCSRLQKFPWSKSSIFRCPKILLAFGPWRAFGLLATSLPIGLPMRAAQAWHAFT